METSGRSKVDSNKRSQYLDLLRIMAIFMVLYNHHSVYNFFLIRGKDDWIGVFSMVLSILSKCGPPLFFMISGALLLGKEESFTHIFTHRILRFLIVMALCTLWSCWRNLNVTDIVTVFTRKLNWYLYAYLAFLLLLPLMRILARGMDGKVRRWYILTCILLGAVNGCLVYAQQSFSVFSYTAPLASAWGSAGWHMIFPLLGYVLSTPAPEEGGGSAPRNEDGKHLAALFLLAAASIACSVLLMRLDIQNSQEAHIEQLRQHFVVAPACFVFLACRKMEKFLPEIPLLPVISGCTFGIFLLDVNTEWRGRIYNFFDKMMGETVGMFGTSLLAIAVEAVAFGFLIWAVKKIFPPARKLL